MIYNIILSIATLIYITLSLIRIRFLKNEVKNLYNKVEDLLVDKYRLTTIIRDLKLKDKSSKEENKDQKSFKDFLTEIKKQAREEYFAEEGYKSIPGMENMSPKEAELYSKKIKEEQ